MSRKRIDMVGKKYGRLTGLELMRMESGHAMWKFECDCGEVIVTRGADVRSGKSSSCGCYRDEETKKYTKGISPKDRKKKNVKA